MYFPLYTVSLAYSKGFIMFHPSLRGMHTSFVCGKLLVDSSFGILQTDGAPPIARVGPSECNWKARIACRYKPGPAYAYTISILFRWLVLIPSHPK